MFEWDAVLVPAEPRSRRSGGVCASEKEAVRNVEYALASAPAGAWGLVRHVEVDWTKIGVWRRGSCRRAERDGQGAITWSGER
ncbi:MAG: hypothetical protein ACRDN9_04890 [Streptosporangiaceae bacterium]